MIQSSIQTLFNQIRVKLRLLWRLPQISDLALEIDDCNECEMNHDVFCFNHAIHMSKVAAIPPHSHPRSVLKSMIDDPEITIVNDPAQP